ncbi:hypothetical protein DFS34DRAFT_651319 [Phlyctochytrium arcticum]|nr:hypothetical protein DFS34DRAFT_651319 [Phlyctochytrium arcticum]
MDSGPSPRGDRISDFPAGITSTEDHSLRALTGAKVEELASNRLTQSQLQSGVLLSTTGVVPSTATESKHGQKGDTTDQLDHKPRPSEHMQNALMTTAERLSASSHAVQPKILMLVNDHESVLKTSSVPLDQPLFQPFPSTIVLQSYSAFETFEITIAFRNNDKVPRRLELEPLQCAFLKILGEPRSNNRKIAPGMEVKYTLQFLPEEEIDYSYHLVCITEREKFVVPFTAIGSRGLLDLPDSVTFPGALVKHKSSKTILVRNIGTRSVKFELTTSSPPVFLVKPNSGWLDQKSYLQLEIEFLPQHAIAYNEYLKVQYDTGEAVYVNLIGVAEVANIRLDKQTIRMNQTFISLNSLQTVKLINRSDILATYKWKRFADQGQEIEHRIRQVASILGSTDSPREGSDHSAATDRSLTMEGCLTLQKQKNDLHQLSNEEFLFQSSVFQIDPVEGVVWPNSSVEFTVLFAPLKPGAQSEMLYCDVAGRDIRLPLQLKGEGIGPKARFSYDMLDLEDIFVDTVHTYELTVENRGDIGAHFKLIPSLSDFGPKFTFSPSEGFLPVGARVPISIRFHPTSLGLLFEEFQWVLEGAEDPIILTFKGKVIGPTFRFDQESLDFGTVAYGFIACQEFTLKNTSQISMSYALRISPNDLDDFEIQQSTGWISANGEQKIIVALKPKKIRTYDLHITVDVDGVGKDILRLPVRAKSTVAEIKLQSFSLEYGDCFLSYPYRHTITLINSTSFAARYMLLKQEESARSVFEYNSINANGEILPNSTVGIDVEIRIKRLGPLNFPVFLSIEGNEEFPMVVDITANGIGPNVQISANELNWGKIPVLKSMPMQLTIANESPIIAEFHCVTVSEQSVYTVEPSSGCIDAMKETTLTVTAFLDDTLKFTDILKIMIRCGGTLEVHLVARGQGTTITHNEDLRKVSFGDVFSSRECTREFNLSNKGRRSQTLIWTCEDRRPKDGLGATESIFEVVPSRFTLKPNADQTIQIKGFSAKALETSETLACHSVMDKDPSRRMVLATQVSANFVNPLVKITPSSLKFYAANEGDVVGSPLTEVLSLRNTSTLPLTISFKCPNGSYKVDPLSLASALNPSQTTSIRVTYDPSFHTDRISIKEQSKLFLRYAEHPQRDFVEIQSEVTFPNLQFETTALQFGCISINAEHRKSLSVTNGGVLPVSYSWGYEPHAADHRHVSATQNQQSPTVFEMFDIQPLQGILQPGESEILNVTLRGHCCGLYRGVAYCDVKGGPRYELALEGEVSMIDFSFDKRSVDFGTQSYQDILEQEVIISNLGKVVFDYNVVLLPSSPLHQRAAIYPASGSLSPKSKLRLTVRCCFVIPEAVEDYFYVQIANFEPIKIRLTGVGTFPRLSINLPRVVDEEYEKILNEAKNNSSRKVRQSLAILESFGKTGDNDIETYSDRILLREKTTAFLSQLDEELRARVSNAPKSKFVGSPLLYYKNQQVKAGEKKNNITLSESSQIRLATYLCDFGNVIRNTQKRKTIRVKNTGSQAVSFSLDRGNLSGTGFSIEPDKVRLLPGSPHNESVDIHISFQARNVSGGQELGLLNFDVPIKITNGPSLGLVVRANVTVPDVLVTPPEIDFGDVLCGYRKTMCVALSNPFTVQCEWAVVTQDVHEQSLARKRQKKRIGGKLVNEIELSPPFGVLQPGESTFLSVRFMPADDRLYDETLSIKVAMNTRMQNLRVTGKGVQPTIIFEPDSLVMGPVLPFTEGVMRKFIAYNPTDYPLEMFSLEYDQQYLEEEELLRYIDTYENGILFSTPRAPGGGLPDAIVDAAMSKMKSDRSVKDATSHDGGQGVGELAEPAVGIANNLQGKTAKSYAMLPQVFTGSNPANDHAANPPPEPSFILILHGPPFSGRRTQGKRIAKAFNFAYIIVDDVIESHLFLEASHSGEAAGKSKDAVNGPDQHVSKRHPFTTGEDDDSTRLSHDRDDADGQRESLPESSNPLSEDSCTDLLRTRLQKDDCARGAVLVGLESRYCGVVQLCRAIQRACAGCWRRPLLVNLNVDVTHIRERESAIQRVPGDRELDGIHVEEVNEEDYDNMNDNEKEKYDHMIAKYRRRLKEQQDRKKLEHRHWEEELALRLNERKAEEEKVRAKKGTRRMPITTRVVDKTAPSPGSRSDVKHSRSNLFSVDAKNGSLSPKLAKRLGIDKMEKMSEKGGPRSEIGERIEKDWIEDLSSRFTLSEGGELFLNESTYRRVDNWSSTLENIMNIMKDGDKPSHGKQLITSTTLPEKKPAKTRVVVAGSADTAPSNLPSVLPDAEQHGMDDTASRYFIELNGNLEEDMVFRAIADLLPVQGRTDERRVLGQEQPESSLEQIIYFPHERNEPSPNLRHFSLYGPIILADGEEDYPSSADQNAVTLAASTAGSSGVPSTVPASISKGESGKKFRPSARVLDDPRVQLETDEDVERDDIRRYRWVIGPHERRELMVKFTASEVGKFEQTLSFGLVGARARLATKCVGHCQYSQIPNEPKRIFSKWRKTKDEKTIVHGEYVSSTGIFEFGPLLYSKPREKYLDRFPENRAQLTFTNPGKADIRLAFGFRHDVKGDVFFFDPPGLDLPSGQSGVLSVWAYPRNTNFVDDTLVVCVKDNPEPYYFRMTCVGVKPELEVDKRTLSFEKLLLGKVERRELRLRNNTLLPVAWKLVGADALGDEFQVQPLEGVLGPAQECLISADFKGTKPVVVKKAVRLEISDVEKIAGVVQEVPVLVTAEAYDIAIDLHFPKGYEGGLDFGVIKVYEEGKQMCTFKNKGKYEVGYRFSFDSREIGDLFSVTPQQGIIQPSDKPYQVQLVFRSTRELAIRDNIACKCQFFEPITGEVTATIPIKLSGRSVFSRFSILPVRDLNFGALVHGTKATRQFIIENLGEFDFRYSIYKLVAALAEIKVGGKTRTNSRASKTGGRMSPPPVTKVVNRKEVIKQGDTLNFGAFAVFPTSGMVAAGQKQPITVEFHSDTPGSFEEIAAIDISDRSPSDFPEIIEYRLIGESCIPGISAFDYAAIFEEHTLCKRSEYHSVLTSYFAEEDRIFFFGPYLVGQQAQARFKVTNPFKVPCEVSISTRPRSKTRGDSAEFAFDSEPKRMSIPSHESRYVNVTFHPMFIQTYAGIFEATVENVADSKTKTLLFEIRGEGTLPRVTIERPVVKSKSGHSQLLFKKSLVGSSQSLMIGLKNEGIIPANFKLEWASVDGESFHCSAIDHTHYLRPQESRQIEVVCRAIAARKYEAEIRLRVIDNSFEDSVIQLFGEGYVDDMSFEKLPNEAENEIVFGNCFVNSPRHVGFNVTNHCHEFLRLAFTSNENFKLAPSTFHIRPKSSKDVTATFVSEEPCEIAKLALAVKCNKIRYHGVSTDVDWDDSARIVRWVVSDPTRVPTPKKVLEQIAEPHHEVLPSGMTDRVIFASALADYSSYECDVSSVHFKETLMFQKRVYRLGIRNSGRVLLHFNFKFFMDSNDKAIMGGSDCPFSIDPQIGDIEVGCTTTFILSFNPMDQDSYSASLVCSMPNLAPGARTLSISVRGRSKRPFCHFEIDDTGYLLRRNNLDLLPAAPPVSVDPQTRVLEFFSCGVKVKNIKRFYLVNPTDLTYEFSWAAQGDDCRIFRCLTPKGTVMAHKKYEMAFEFSPDSTDLKEYLWKFSIPTHHIVVPFVLVGQAVEPNLVMDRVNVNFKSVLIGHQAREVVNLINNENVPFNFAIADTSVEMSPEGVPVIRYSPSAGMVPAHSQVPVEITFLPCLEKTFNYNLVCNVRKKPSPITINVKGEGYTMHDSLQSELPDGTLSQIFPGPIPNNYIDFGSVQINDKRVRRIVLINSGRYNFDFDWKFQGKRHNVVAITPESGTVRKGERLVCDLSFVPTLPVTLNRLRATCRIINGSVYHINLNGIGCKPLLKMSKPSHDFGTQIIHTTGVQSDSVMIELTNEDVSDIQFDVGPRDSAIFEVRKSTLNLAPGEKCQIEVAFYPKEAVVYAEIIKLEINGLSTTEISVQGEGAEFKVDLLQTEQRFVQFGAIRIGHSAQKVLKLINRGLIPLTFQIGPSGTLDTLIARGISLQPRGPITLRPRAVCSLDIRFSPISRIPAFSEDLSIEGYGMTLPLTSISGACQGIDVRLENDTLPFGAIVFQSSTVKRVQLQNLGDVGVTFRWDTSHFLPDFSITPSEGYISPGMDIGLEVAFHPVELNPDIRYENLTCHIGNMPPIFLTLTGMCIPAPIQNEILKFATPVRQLETKSVTITNRTSSNWHIRPVIENDFWSGGEVFDLEAGQSRPYDLTFTPLEMSGDGEGGRHEGSLFFPLPDGTGLLYKLVGFADKPLATGNINRDIPSKTAFTETFSVHNWLKRPQRLKVIYDLAKPDPSVILKGHDFIDVPALISKDYKLTFYAYKECITTGRIIFRDESTQEFLFYNVTFRSTAPGVISTFDLATNVRQAVTKEITIQNPLANPVTFSATCNSPDITVPHTFSVGARTDLSCIIEYLPLHARDSMSRLILSSSELGIYQYDLKLSATAPPPERTMHFKIGLGASQSQTFRFLSYAKMKTEFTCKIESSDFSVEKTTTAPAAPQGGSVEVCTDIVYEPSKLGDSRTQLLISSAVGGDYSCTLVGHCYPPRPQGPIIIKTGTLITIPFKNVFNSSATFTFIVDNPAFTVRGVENVGAKKTIQISVAFKPPSGMPFTPSNDRSEKEESTSGSNSRREKLDRSKDSSAAGTSAPTLSNPSPNAALSSTKSNMNAARVGKLSITHVESNVVWVYYLKATAN